MQTIINPVTDQVIVANKQVIDKSIASELDRLNIDAVQVRSPLTCESASGCCALCYGHDLSTSELVEEGIETRKHKEKVFFELAERFRTATDPDEVARLGDELGTMVFGK